jgi:hypothetical protein
MLSTSISAIVGRRSGSVMWRKICRRVDVVERSVRRVEAVEQQRGGGEADRPGEEIDGSQEAGAAAVLLHEQGESHRDRGQHDGDDRRVLEREDDRVKEQLVVGDPRVVVGPVDGGLAEQPPAVHRHPEDEPERQQEEDADHHGHGRRVADPLEGPQAPVRASRPRSYRRSEGLDHC